MGKNTIEISDVKHVARLSRLEFTENELIKIQSDLSGVVEHFSSLSTVDTSTVSDIDSEIGIVRADEVLTSFKKEEVIKNAPAHNGSAFIVPRVVE